jgi:hypothetical protein
VILAAMRPQSLNALVGKDNVIRVDAPESPASTDMDDYRRATVELPAMARSLVEASGQHGAVIPVGDRKLNLSFGTAWSRCLRRRSR